ncbi:hypothetical protein ACWGJP_04305 [Microbacterium sp. NPDC055903]
MGTAPVDAVTVDLAPLRRPAGLGDILECERICGIPWYRRFLVVLTGVVLLGVAMGVALWWLADAGILQAAPILGLFAAGYGLLAATSFAWFTATLGRRAKIAAFAWRNGWAYADSLEHTRRPGSAFTRVLRGRERAVVAGDDPRMPFELGYHYSVARGRDEAATVQKPFAFIEMPLPQKVPHIVLRNRGRSIIPSLGFGKGNARMELEGEFAKHFLLFVPEGYQQDALYIFTPDLMARVIDLGRGAEIELAGDRLYVYLPHRTRFDKPDTMAAVLVLAEEFHRRFAARTAHYRDDQRDATMAAAGVAIGLRGQRLKGGGVSIMAIAGTAGVLLLSGAVMAFSLFGAPLLFG